MCDSLKKFKGWSLSASLNHMTFADLPFMHPALSHKAFGKHLEGFSDAFWMRRELPNLTRVEKISGGYISIALIKVSSFTHDSR